MLSISCETMLIYSGVMSTSPCTCAVESVSQSYTTPCSPFLSFCQQQAVHSGGRCISYAAQVCGRVLTYGRHWLSGGSLWEPCRDCVLCCAGDIHAVLCMPAVCCAVHALSHAVLRLHAGLCMRHPCCAVHVPSTLCCACLAHAVLCMRHPYCAVHASSMLYFACLSYAVLGMLFPMLCCACIIHAVLCMPFSCCAVHPGIIL